MKIGPWEVTWGRWLPAVLPEPALRAEEVRAGLRANAAFVTGALDQVLCEAIRSAAGEVAVPYSRFNAGHGHPGPVGEVELARRAEKLHTLHTLRLELRRALQEANAELAEAQGGKRKG